MRVLVPCLVILPALLASSLPTTAAPNEIDGQASPISSMEDLWKDLACNNAPRGLAEITMVTMVNKGPDTVFFLKDKLKFRPVDLPIPGQARKAMEDLDHESFDVREKAEQDLLLMGDVIAPTLHAVVAATKSPEVRIRGNRILEVILSPIPSSGEFLRRWRAIRVLELIGTDEAREALKTVEMSSPSPRERIEAKEALERLNHPHQTKAVSDEQQPPPAGEAPDPFAIPPQQQ